MVDSLVNRQGVANDAEPSRQFHLLVESLH